MIRASNLTKRFDGRAAVDGLTFEIPRGQIVGFLGPNGAGKTTTMRLLTGFLPADEGRAEVLGLDVAREPLAARARLGYLPENNPLYDELEAIDSLRFTARLRGMAPARAAERIRAVVRQCGLKSAAGKRAGELSKGFRQRLGLAHAILHEPDVLILDEPTSGLDPNQVEDARALIRELGREKTVLLSTHVLQEVAALCDRVLIISQGKLEADGSPAQLRAKLEGGKRLSARLKAPLDLARAALASLPGVASVEPREVDGGEGFSISCAPGEDPREAIFELAVSRRWPLLALHEERLSLEDVFHRLTSGT